MTTISKVRQNLFAYAEAASRGERVEFEYKGITLRLVADLKASKLSRLEPINVLAKGVSIEQVEAALKQVHSAKMADWDKKPF